MRRKLTDDDIVSILLWCVSVVCLVAIVLNFWMI